MKKSDRVLSDIGEKRLISRYLRPLLNPRALPEGVGDDCALVQVRNGHGVCLSTDRVPADLIPFRLGLIGYRELGQYLAVFVTGYRVATRIVATLWPVALLGIARVKRAFAFSAASAAIAKITMPTDTSGNAAIVVTASVTAGRPDTGDSTRTMSRATGFAIRFSRRIQLRHVFSFGTATPSRR